MSAGRPGYLETEGLSIMLAQASIRAKITIVVSFLLIALAGTGLLAVRNMQAINANAIDIQTNWLPSVAALGDLRAGVIRYRNVTREHLLAETADEKAAVDKKMQSIDANIATFRTTYEKLITSPEEHAMYREWGQLWDSYTKGIQEVLNLSRQSVGRIPHEAN